MIETAIRQLIDHPRGMLIVITLSFVLGLALVLPLADEYSALREEADNLHQSLSEAQLERQNLPLFEKRIENQESELAALEDKAISDDEASEFRHRMVALVRESGCQVRKVSLSDPKQRDWLQDDNPVRTIRRTGKKQKKTEYQLKSRVFALSVSGTAEDVRSLLAAIHREQPLAYTRSLSLRPADGQRTEVVLEIELWLFELEKNQAVSA